MGIEELRRKSQVKTFWKIPIFFECKLQGCHPYINLNIWMTSVFFTLN